MKDLLRKLQRPYLLEIALISPMIVFFACGVAQAWAGAIGPFVFADESEYAEMARALLSGDFLITGKTQYGPLFPLVIAVLSRLFTVDVYVAGKIANGIAWGASALAMFQIARLLGGGWIYRWGGALLTLVAPFWTFALVTWADPMFYFLFFASCLALLLVLRNSHIGFRVLLGTVLGLLFLAKPVGIFYALALFAALAVLCWFRKRTQYFIDIGQIGAVWVFCVAPWMLRNLTEAGSILGYSYAGRLLNEMFAVQGWGAVLPLIIGLCYQLAYVSLLSFGFFGVLILILIKSRRNIDDAMVGVVTYVLLSLTLVILISDLHMVPNPVLGYWIPNGRYFSQYLPPVVLLSLLIFSKARLSGEAWALWLLLVLLAEIALTVLATPVKMAAPYSIVNNPDMGLMFLWDYFRSGSFLTWQSINVPDRYQVVLSAVLVATPLLLLRRSVPTPAAQTDATTCSRDRVVLLLILAVVGAGSAVEYLAFTQMQQVQSGHNTLYTSHRSEMCGGRLYVEENLDLVSLEFVHRFWCEGEKFSTFRQDTDISRLGKISLLMRADSTYPPGCLKIAEIQTSGHTLLHCGR